MRDFDTTSLRATRPVLVSAATYDLPDFASGLGGTFFGESMFHRVTDASKIALVALVEHLRARKFVLLDTQWLTPHLQQFGGIQISRSHYLRLLRRAVDLPLRFL